VTALKLFVEELNTSAEATAPAAVCPPRINTSPSGSNVAVWPARGVVMADASAVKVSVAGSKSSAETRTSESLRPPVIKICPLGRRVAV